MLSEDENNIIGRIYDAALNPQLWPDVLKNIVEMTASKTAIFTALDQLNPDYDFVFTHQIPIEGLNAYQDEHIKVIDMKLHTQLWQQVGVGGIVKQNLASYAQMPQYSDQYIFYEKCLKPTNIIHIGAVLLEEGKHRWSVLAVHRSPQCRAFRDDELETLTRLATHLRRALQIHRQLSSVKQENRELYQILDCLKTGVIILGEDKQICYSNPKATQILEHSSLLFPDQYNRLKTLLHFQNQLNEAIDSALYPQVTANTFQYGGVIGLYEQPQDTPLMLTVVPLSNVKLAAISDISHQRVAVFLTETSKQKLLAKPFMHDCYGLSKRELQICELFLNGYNLEQIAEYCEISLQTVRTYLKKFFPKHIVHRKQSF
ncbi:LuxR C-terminal-related transcriptional regulator [Acinetobacter sp. NIPH 2699]|uniref:LuxR C-terminal-related transcriptional regulator n=1 Tax=Acinetobacter sp. NIPH 2699 TaxID=2923433 RepID=UPI001F4BA182|nr:LuxR C-terminal-related transcriptional regulator [Acinetobacter sp. NIPH 2699]MCH7336514.1 LuxR C-terminal-related transcriptional regulator [Acinetobacter sp. NIPH 2699]